MSCRPFVRPCGGCWKASWASSGVIACCCRRGQADGELPALAAPNLARTIEWHGPATGWNTETRYLQERIKGRGSRRKLNDIVIRYEGQVARLQQDESRMKRIDAYGLRVQFAGIAGCSSRAFRKKLDDVGEVHPMPKGRLWAGPRANIYVSLRASTTNPSLTFTSTPGGVMLAVESFVAWFSLGTWVAFGPHAHVCAVDAARGVGFRKQTRADGSTRMLHPDSESEVEQEDNTCEGVRVRNSG